MLYVISAVGKDKPGLVHLVSEILAKMNINIVDVDARSVRGHFSIFMVVDLGTSSADYSEMVDALDAISSHYNLGIRSEKYEAGRRTTNKELMVITMMGADRPGLVASLSEFLSKNSINIETIKMIARGDYIAMELKIDVRDVSDMNSLRKELYIHAEKMKMDISLRSFDSFKKQKRVIIFDCDSTIIQQEVIDELAKIAGVGESVKKITADAMNGKIQFSKAFHSRVMLLKGFPSEKLRELIDTIKFTPGADELVSTLKSMGFKVGVISGGFTFFTDYLKEKLKLDYVFANELEIVDGKITGNIIGKIVDAKRKGEILEEIAKIEGITKDQIVAVGDGANDRFMFKNAGLAIGFNPKEILKDYSHGIISGNNIYGLLYFLGNPNSPIKYKDI